MSTDDRAAKQDIAEVLVRYATSIDRRDWTSFRTCFTDRCDVEYEGAGSWHDVEAITEFMTAVHAGMGHTLHRVSNLDTPTNTTPNPVTVSAPIAHHLYSRRSR